MGSEVRTVAAAKNGPNVRKLALITGACLVTFLGLLSLFLALNQRDIRILTAVFQVAMGLWLCFFMLNRFEEKRRGN